MMDGMAKKYTNKISRDNNNRREAYILFNRVFYEKCVGMHLVCYSLLILFVYVLAIPFIPTYRSSIYLLFMFIFWQYNY